MTLSRCVGCGQVVSTTAGDGLCPPCFDRRLRTHGPPKDWCAAPSLRRTATNRSFWRGCGSCDFCAYRNVWPPRRRID